MALSWATSGATQLIISWIFWEAVPTGDLLSTETAAVLRRLIIVSYFSFQACARNLFLLRFLRKFVLAILHRRHMLKMRGIYVHRGQIREIFEDHNWCEIYGFYSQFCFPSFILLDLVWYE